MSYEADIISLEPGQEVHLYKIDLNTIGIDVELYFTPSDQLGGSLWWRGNEYVSRDIEIEGLNKSSDDVPAEPTLSIGNVDKGGNALLAQYGDLLGVEITRYRTYAQYLDKLPDGSPNPTADVNAMGLPEVWYIEQKLANTPAFIQWKLSSVLDLQGIEIPNRLILKDICQREYRVWNPTSGTFQYSLVNTCPYNGSAMFGTDNQPTATPALDKCSKNLRGCTARFPNETLPGYFFPGVNRYPR